MAKDVTEKFAELIGAGKLQEAMDELTRAGHKRPDGQFSVPNPILHGGLKAALENQRPKELAFLLNFGDDTNKHTFLFKNRWNPNAAGEKGPWSYLLSDIRRGNADFEKCEDLLLEDVGIGLDVPKDLSDESALRPIHSYAGDGDARGIAKLKKHGASPNGHDPQNSSEFMSRRPASSPMLFALVNGHGEAALELAKMGLKESLFPKENWSHAAARGVRQAQDRGDLEGGLLALRVACCAKDPLSGLEGRQPWLIDRPLDSEASLALFLVSLAREADRALAPREPESEKESEAKTEAPKRNPEAPGSWFSRLAGLARKKIESPEQAEQAEEAEAALESAKEDAANPKRKDPSGEDVWRSASAKALEALGRRDPEGFADWASRAEGPSEKASLLLSAMACAKCAYWAMPMPGGVGDDGRDIDGWACFKAALKALRPEEISAPIREVGSLSALSVACALGYEDAAVELARAGASLLPDPLREPPSPLALAIRRGKGSLAERLLSAGADPMDGIQAGPLGLPQRAWPIWEAFAARDAEMFGKLLEAAPAARECPGPKGESLLEAIVALESSVDAATGTKPGEAFAKEARARLEGSYIQAAAKEPEPEEGGEPGQWARPRQPRGNPGL